MSEWITHRLVGEDLTRLAVAGADGSAAERR